MLSTLECGLVPWGALLPGSSRFFRPLQQGTLSALSLPTERSLRHPWRNPCSRVVQRGCILVAQRQSASESFTRSAFPRPPCRAWLQEANQLEYNFEVDEMVFNDDRLGTLLS